MPALYGGFGNYFIPLFIGGAEVGFPRINLYSLLLLVGGYYYILCSIILEFGGGTAWTIYPPLSTSLMNLSPLALDFIIIGLVISGISSLLSSINFLETILFYFSNYFYLFYCLGILLTAILLIFSLPILSSALIILLSDLHFNSSFFDPAFGGDPIFYQHLFWFFGHPEVYILILPAFGFISHIIEIIVVKLIFGNESMILAMGCISVIGIIVWGHHMFTVGMEIDTKLYFTTITILISIPTGTKIFNWNTTILYNYFGLGYGLVYFIWVFIIEFNLGGITGVILGNTGIDVALHDSYYVVAHFHFVLSLGAIVSVIVCIFYYLEIILLEMVFSINILFIYFLCLFVFGINILFIILHYFGFNIIPRRIPDYLGFLNFWNIISSLGSSVIIFSFGLLIA